MFSLGNSYLLYFHFLYLQLKYTNFLDIFIIIFSFSIFAVIKIISTYNLGNYLFNQNCFWKLLILIDFH